MGLPLIPLGWLFRCIVALRRLSYRIHILPSYRASVPVIVVGNLSVGGTGKTPLVIWLCNFLKSQNFRPGIVARGYGGTAMVWPQPVRPDSDPNAVGDEAVVMARHCHCPIAVAPDRHMAVEALIEHSDCDIIISDDGLQHYALGRDLEIAVLDGVRRFGNGRCLPAGPLREPPPRLDSVDLVVTHGIGGRGEFNMKYLYKDAVSIIDESRRLPLELFKQQKVHAVAGIGHPGLFFSSLHAKGLLVIKHPFQDHHKYRPEDIQFDDDLPVVMTEKDAVKCRRFATEKSWYLPIEVDMPEVFERRIMTLIKGL